MSRGGGVARYRVVSEAPSVDAGASEDGRRACLLCGVAARFGSAGAEQERETGVASQAALRSAAGSHGASRRRNGDPQFRPAERSERAGTEGFTPLDYSCGEERG